MLGTLLAPAVEASVEARDRDLTQVRALRVINALGAYADANEREASGLADLELPADVMTDPISGGSLVAKPTDAGWLVYGVGKNGVDDAGTLQDARDVGFGPPGPRVEAEDAGD